MERVVVQTKEKMSKAGSCAILSKAKSKGRRNDMNVKREVGKTSKQAGVTSWVQDEGNRDCGL